ncbi:glycerophosphodiester phosphodiesterase 1 [Lampetra planeri]
MHSPMMVVTMSLVWNSLWLLLFLLPLMLLILSRSRSNRTLLAGGGGGAAAAFVSLCGFQSLCFEPVCRQRALQVLRPRSGPGPHGHAVAHRAGGHDAPENTMAAVRKAATNGAHAVELDMAFTEDGVAVLMHDDTVDRTTDGSGPIGAISLANLRNLDASAYHRLREQFKGERVPTLEEAVDECLQLNLIIYFDVKGDAEKSSTVLKQIYESRPELYNKSIVCSFDPRVIYMMRQKDVAVVTALTHRPWVLSHTLEGERLHLGWFRHRWEMLMDVALAWSLNNFLWKLCGISAVLMHKSVISQDYVRWWQERDVSVVGWTVNTAVEKAYYENVLDCNYITDSLEGDA